MTNPTIRKYRKVSVHVDKEAPEIKIRPIDLHRSIQRDLDNLAKYGNVRGL